MLNLQNSLVQRGRRGSLMALQLSAVSLLVALLSGCDKSVAQNGPPPAPAVSVADVVIQPISQWDDFNGRIEAVQSVQLRPRVSGYIDKVPHSQSKRNKTEEH